MRELRITARQAVASFALSRIRKETKFDVDRYAYSMTKLERLPVINVMRDVSSASESVPERLSC